MRSRFLVLLALAAALLISTGCKNGAQSAAASKTPVAAPPIALAPQTNVPRDEPWQLDLPDGLTGDQLEGLAVLKGDQVVATGATAEGRRVTITPVKPYDRKGTYTLRLFAAGGKRYEGPFTTRDYLRVQPGQIHELAADPARGFHFAYFLYVPPGLRPGGTYPLLVAPNDSGGAISDSLLFHAEFARKQLQPSTPARMISNELKLPVLVPVFPYPAAQTGLHTQTLSRRTLQVRQAPFTRVDEQLIAMVADARTMLAGAGIQTDAKFYMYGSAAAGFFTDRFALLHPELVWAAAYGGTSGLMTLPLHSYQGKALPYPAGIADLQEVAGVIYNPQEYMRVPRFAFMTAGDNRDATRDDHIFAASEGELIRSLFGGQVLPERWENMKRLAGELGLPVQFVTYPETGPASTDLIAFFRATLEHAGGAVK